jgi:ATP-dependent RNA helicase MSS116, mitochondrial
MFKLSIRTLRLTVPNTIRQFTIFMMPKESVKPPMRKHAFKKAPSRPTTSLTSRQNIQTDPPRMSTPPLTAPIPSDTMRFADLGKDNLLHPVLLQTITEDLKFDYMMPVQSATLYDLLEKRIDCLAQAKTGTGKTIAFLLPAIQTLINKNRQGNSGVSLLVISPTRELAMQTANEATALLQRLPRYKVSFAIGGTNKDREERDILDGCDILIATPGRLYDHLSDERIKAAFRNLDTLVLDEADRLLDMGFMNALRDIIQCLPDKRLSNRQGMLFSATIAPHVQKFAHLALSDGYKFISTVPKGELNTHERVPQLLITVPSFSEVAPALISALQSERMLVGEDDFKAIIFAPTAALADWYAAILEKIPLLPNVSVLHSRISQNKRTKTSDDFRNADRAILVATDVVARGMDFPNVSTVFQVGLPADKESYIHRLGRTARAGREGRSVFIITADESFFPKYTLKEIKFDIIKPDYSYSQNTRDAALDFDNKAKVYQAWLGYYKGHSRDMGWDNERLVAEANKFALEALGTGEVPGLQKSTVGKMGLKGVRGLNVIPNAPKPSRGGGGGEGRSAGAGGLGEIAFRNGRNGRGGRG